jgi:hypothetical protein
LITKTSSEGDEQTLFVPRQEVLPLEKTSAAVEEIFNLGAPLDFYQERELQIALRKKEHDLNVEKKMLGERTKYAMCIFVLSATWLIFIAVIIVHSGLKTLKFADSVLIALITTTTINVLGLFYIVARWLFPNKENSEQIPKKENKV